MSPSLPLLSPVPPRCHPAVTAPLPPSLWRMVAPGGHPGVLGAPAKYRGAPVGAGETREVLGSTQGCWESLRSDGGRGGRDLGMLGGIRGTPGCCWGHGVLLGAPQGAAGGTWECWGVLGAPKGAAGGTWPCWGHPRVQQEGPGSAGGTPGCRGVGT